MGHALNHNPTPCVLWWHVVTLTKVLEIKTLFVLCIYNDRRVVIGQPDDRRLSYDDRRIRDECIILCIQWVTSTVSFIWNEESCSKYRNNILANNLFTSKQGLLTPANISLFWMKGYGCCHSLGKHLNVRGIFKVKIKIHFNFFFVSTKLCPFYSFRPSHIHHSLSAPS